MKNKMTTANSAKYAYLICSAICFILRSFSVGLFCCCRRRCCCCCFFVFFYRLFAYLYHTESAMPPSTLLSFDLKWKIFDCACNMHKLYKMLFYFSLAACVHLFSQSLLVAVHLFHSFCFPCRLRFHLPFPLADLLEIWKNTILRKSNGYEISRNSCVCARVCVLSKFIEMWNKMKQRAQTNERKTPANEHYIVLFSI